MESDICVVGAGPAGSALTYTLASFGRRVLWISRDEHNPIILGESLAPAALAVLGGMGVHEDMLRGGHLRSYGNESAWGTDDIRFTDFIVNPYGDGWHIDRNQFDLRLRSRAGSSEAVMMRCGSICGIERTGSRVRIKLKNAGQSWNCESKFIADCTGRESWVARCLGIRRKIEDRLVAFALAFARIPPEKPEERRLTSLVEASREGWWYTACIPNSLRVVVYYTDADLQSCKVGRTLEGFLSLLGETRHLRQRCAGWTPTIPRPWVRCANSAHLERITGDLWVAVGDAALSFDPLSSQGILRALQGGVTAAYAIESELRGDGSRLRMYEQALTRANSEYMAQRRAYYTREERWPDSQFWQRRRLPVFENAA